VQDFQSFFSIFDVVCCLLVMDFGFAFFIVWVALSVDWLEFYAIFWGYAFGGVWMCSIRRSFYGRQVKFWVMHLFWWSITFFWLDCFDGFWRILFPVLSVRDECFNICTTC
jgi:hypothetical protein